MCRSHHQQAGVILPHALEPPYRGIRIATPGGTNSGESEAMTKAQLEYQEYLQTPYWKKASEEVKRRAGYRCQVCNSDKALETHHRSYEHRGNEMEHLEDLICLCHSCHDTFHKSGRSLERTPSRKTPKRAKPVVVRALPPPTVSPSVLKRMEEFGCADMAWGRWVKGTIDFEAILAQLPQREGSFVLTKELLDRCRRRAPHGAFNSATVEALGMSHARRGWPNRIVGTQISWQAYLRALLGRQLRGKAVRFQSLIKPAA